VMLALVSVRSPMLTAREGSERAHAERPSNHEREPPMSNVERSVPVDLTAARIRRANPSIDEETAREDVAVLHDIIACVRQAYAAHPKPYPEF
jgi:hypothetical protein